MALTLAGIDQASKAWALGNLSDGETIPLLGHALRLHLTLNGGGALSLGDGATWLFTLVTVGVIVAVLVVLPRLASTGWLMVAALVLGGGAGNLVDRLARPPGFGRGLVVDFIAYGDLFIGNVADIGIVLAVVLVFWLMLRGVPIIRPPRAAPDPATAEKASDDAG
ncbi:MAG: signal peptidase II [Bifidobacteriaceae bacterium]|nr:signal peptidase II [Bifidobacteriaceae bacterium]